MASSASKTLLILTAPVIFISFLWFLKKKNSSSEQFGKDKHKNIYFSSDHSQLLYPMKLENPLNTGVNTECGEMHLKEQNDSGKQHSISKVQKNKTHENGTIHKNKCDSIELSSGIGELSLNEGRSTEDVLMAAAHVGSHYRRERVISGKKNGHNVDINYFVLDKTKISASDTETLTDIKSQIKNTDSPVDENSFSMPKTITPEMQQYCISKAFPQNLVGDALTLDANGLSTPIVNGKFSNIYGNSTVECENDIVSKSCNNAIFDTNGNSAQTVDCVKIDTDENSTNVILSVNGDTVQTVNAVKADIKEHLVQAVDVHPSIQITNGMNNEESVECIAADNESNSPNESAVETNEHLIHAEYIITDANQIIPMPVDFVMQNQLVPVEYAMNRSPEPTYSESLLSDDSGHGLSESPNEAHLPVGGLHFFMVFEFELLPEDTGRLIGRQGKHVKYINQETGATIKIRKHPFEKEKKICSVQGSEEQIDHALELIRKRFPLDKFPDLTLEQINCLPISVVCPETLQLPLPEGVAFEAMLCCTLSAGHFFLQQPTHPTFHQLLPLVKKMTELYSAIETPCIEIYTKGIVCAASLMGGWYRAEICDICEVTQQCKLKFLDYGGYADVPMMSIRQIKYDFMTVPFQATECYLAGVMPEKEDWSLAATGLFEELGTGQILQGYIVGYSEDKVPCVNLYKIAGVSNLFINQILINHGFAKEIPVVE